MIGVPDVSKIPGLTDVLDFVGLSADEIQLTVGMGGVMFGIHKTYDLDLPSPPFVGPSQFRLDLMLHPTTMSVSLGGDFAAILDIPILTQPLSFSATAYISAGVGTGVSVGLFGHINSLVELKGFPFVKLGNISIGADVGYQGAPMVNKIDLGGTVSLN